MGLFQPAERNITPCDPSCQAQAPSLGYELRIRRAISVLSRAKPESVSIRERVKRTQPRSAPPHPVTGTVRRLLCAAIISEMTGAAQRSVISAAPQHRPESANHMRDLPNETDGEPGATYSRPPIAISHGRGAHGCRWKVPARTGSGAELPRLPRQE